MNKSLTSAAYGSTYSRERMMLSVPRSLSSDGNGRPPRFKIEFFKGNCEIVVDVEHIRSLLFRRDSCNQKMVMNRLLIARRPGDFFDDAELRLMYNSWDKKGIGPVSKPRVDWKHKNER